MAILNRLLLSIRGKQGPKQTFFFDRARADTLGSQLADRWDDIRGIIDLGPDDEVLDVGCAEGLIAIETARHAKWVHGIEVMPHRVAAAAAFAKAEGVENVSFEHASIKDYEIESLSYDIALFLGVYAVPTPTGPVGGNELKKVLDGARKQVIVRVEVQEMPEAQGRLRSILELMDEAGFDGIAFPKRSPKHGNVIVANRRGSGAVFKNLPELCLMPTGFTRNNPLLKLGAGASE
jgi:SAM-dependent methyltransferase